MLKSLYGEEDLDAAAGNTGLPGEKLSPKEALMDKILKKKDFNTNYCTFIMVSCFKSLCCCFAWCINKNGRCGRKLESHQKFQIARERLNQERDI